MMTRVRVYRRRRRVLLTAACVVSVAAIMAIIPTFPPYVGDTWDGLALVVAAIFWIAFFGSNSHYLVASEIQLRLDRLQDELEDKMDCLWRSSAMMAQLEERVRASNEGMPQQQNGAHDQQQDQQQRQESSGNEAS